MNHSDERHAYLEVNGATAPGTTSTFDAVAEIIRKSLADGHTVEIEGLGSFCARGNRCEFSAQTTPQVFIAYAMEDLILARRLCETLRAEGCSPWLDKDKLLPGQNWPRSIERAIEVSDAFVVCFSPRSILKRGQFQCELRYALDCARRRPLEETFLIPARLEDCPLPVRITDQVQYVDLFPDWEKGVRRIARAVRKTAGKRPTLVMR